jgi:XTP/dITP diphosphohydrolase
MHELLLGTRNPGKIAEIVHLLRDIDRLTLLTLAERPFDEVPEIGETFLDNALLKAGGIAAQTGLPVLAEDAGLEVSALDGAPGVRSARYAGLPVDYARNNELLLDRLKGVENRRARFVTVAVLQLPDGEVFVATGTLPGRIATEPAGTGGFGYDPLFVADGSDRTLAELSMAEKGRISHRMQALRRMRPILLDLIGD